MSIQESQEKSKENFEGMQPENFKQSVKEYLIIYTYISVVFFILFADQCRVTYTLCRLPLVN